MDILVKGDAVRIPFARVERHRDVVDVVAGLEVTGDVGWSSLVERFEWGERGVVAKDDDGCRHRGVEDVARNESGEGAVEELEPGGDLAQLFRVGVADDEEIVGADAAPLVARLSFGGRRDGEQ